MPTLDQIVDGVQQRAEDARDQLNDIVDDAMADGGSAEVLIPALGASRGAERISAGAGRAGDRALTALEEATGDAADSVRSVNTTVKVLLVIGGIILAIILVTVFVIWARVGWQLPELLPALTEAFSSGLIPT